ncbi:MAG TPA: leucine-rich repeat domain-containing protein [Flavobacteriales bacterium]|nr:leucine-rich repeat domain-containing protein [Flavobacteriales bacterium]
MRTLLTVLATIAAACTMHAQLLDEAALDSARTFRTIERAMQDPDHVYRLDLSGKKLKVLPEEIKRFKNLNALDIGSNKLRVLPEWLGELTNLQEFRSSQNKLVDFPVFVCKLKHLKRLDLSRNALTGLPKCMGGLKELVSLDLWDNDLVDFPDGIEGMEALRFLDLRNIQFEQPEMDHIQELLPRAKIFFSQPCNCGM